jgi:oxamate amidohydrolase
MLRTTKGYSGMVTAPHHLAAQAGLEVLRDGGNAIEAMIAAAATVAVVYPHMNGLGGDGFWLIGRPGHPSRRSRPAGVRPRLPTAIGTVSTDARRSRRAGPSRR